ncbi:MAG TPA: nickel pincer cofactor biosynthesis protein LarB [Myxococcales bacterium]|nr:nickel pincer cofactor biosynthesis protein LarB [Myxococcales bacterium]
MDLNGLSEFLERVRRGELAVADAARTLAELPVQRIADFAQLDGDRAVRQGVPEVIFGERKSPEQIGQLVARLRELGQAVLVTRLGPEGAEAARAAAPEGRYDAISRTFHARPPGPAREPQGVVAVVCAGTTDIPVAEEAAVTAGFVGAAVERLYDVGVSGIHRLLRRAPDLRAADALVVCAGMEGALPSVVGGLVPRPVIAVPTSVGYGASLGGLAALLAMLNSCAANVSVVNIDNGFGAGFQAALIARAAAGGRAL